MSFVTDGSDIPGPKVQWDGRVQSTPLTQPNMWVTHSDYNIIRQDLFDIRDFLNGTEGPADVLIGDSNAMGAGADASKTSGEFTVLIPDDAISFHNKYATSAADPPTWIIQDTGTLRTFNFSGADRFGPERGLAQTLNSQLYAGRGIRPVILKHAISGIKAADWKPGGTFALATTGKNLYDTWRDDTLALLALLRRKMRSLTMVLGGNDGTNAPDAGNLQANLLLLFDHIWLDFGPQVSIALFRTSANVDPAVVTQLATIRAAAAAAVALRANTRLLDTDRAPLNSDLIHWTGDAQEQLGAAAAFAHIDAQGFSRATVTAAPVRVVGYGIAGYGTSANGTGTVKPQPWAGTRPGDTLYMYVTQGFAGAAIATPANWTLKANGSSADIGVTEVYAVFERKLVQADFDSFGQGPTVSVPCAGGNTENAAQIFTVRGVPGRNPSAEASLAITDNHYNTGPLAANSVATLTKNAALLCFAGGLSALGGGLTITNAGVVNLVKVKDSVYPTNTDFRGIALSFGSLLNPGNPGAWSVSGATNCFKGVITLSITA